MKRTAKIFLVLILFVGAYVLAAELRLRPQVNRYAKYWQNETAKASQEGEIVYGVLGDSTAQGIGASDPEHSYPAIFAKRLRGKTGKPVHIVNVSKSGARTTDVLDRQINALLSFKPDIITVEIGTNDIYHGTSKEEIVQNLENIMKQLPQGTIIAEIPYLMWPGKNAEAKFINNELQRIVSANNQKIAPLYSLTKHNHIKLNTYSVDFYHPNNKGYESWADVFWNTYAPLNDEASYLQTEMFSSTLTLDHNF